MKFFTRILERVSPDALANKAYQRLSHPQQHKLRDFEQHVLKEARKSTRKFKAFDIAEYKWGYGPKQALFVHGWEGQSGNFAALIPVLVDAGYTVNAFDAPSHGASTKAETSLFDYSELVSQFLGERRYDLFISHSFGAVPLTLALSEQKEYPVNRLLLVTSPNSFRDRVQQIADQMGVTSRTTDRVIQRFRAETKKDPDQLSVAQFCTKLQPVRALVVHGGEDRVLKMEWSRAVAEALPNGEFKVLDGLGHYRILWSEELQRELHDLITD
jgi:pimeloyl-ACP methyl ester carboxylesterase